MHDHLFQMQASQLLQLPTGVFTVSAAAQRGVTKAQLYALLRAGLLVRLGRGIYRHAADTEVELAAWLFARAAQLGSDVIVAHASAAVLWKLRTPHMAASQRRELCILRDRSNFGARLYSDVRTLPSQFSPEHVTTLRGVTVTTLARTALDVARNCTFDRAVVATDHALALGVSREELVDIAQYMNGWPGTRVFRPSILWADALAESGLESIVRARILARGMPVPSLQVPISGVSGAQYRGDLGWLQQRVLLEVDGRDKYDGGRDALIAEKLRESDIAKAGWAVIRMMYDDVLHDESRPWQELADALGVPLRPCDPEFGLNPRWDVPRRRRHR